MRKTYINIIIVLIIMSAGVLTYVNNTRQTDIVGDTPLATTTLPVSYDATYTINEEEIVKDFEGEADPTTMKLDMKTWTWIRTTYSNGTVVTPKQPDAFTLKLTGTNFSASTDCNGVGGEYVTKGSNISFDKMMSTQMFCQGSQETDFTKSLSAASSYHFTSKGELVFDLKMDSGSMIFR